jgi:tol-pal system beta propeller repeat protein TolB
MKTYFSFCFLFLIFSCKAQTTPTVLLSEEHVENAYPRLSQDGQSILYQSNRSGNWQLYLLDIASKKSRQITSTGNNNFPDWSADNKWIAYVSDKDGNEEIYLVRKDGSNEKRLTNNAARDIHPYFSPDGKYILFNSTRGNGSLDIYRLTLANGKTERFTETEENETCARYSPDMTKLVFLRNDDASDDVYVMDMNTALTTNITQDPTVRNGWPVFSPDGHWVYYSSMQSGLFCIYRIKPDGSGKEQLSHAKAGEEDARVHLVAGSRQFIYNKRHSNKIEILATETP